MAVVLTGKFQDASGAAVANGTLFLTLSQTAVLSGTAQIAPSVVSILLDSSGSISASAPQIYGNDALSPGGTGYFAKVVNANGQTVWQPSQIIFIAGASFNFNAALPSSPGLTFANAVLQNPSSAQTITGFGLTLTASAPLTVTTLTVSGSATFSSNLTGTFNSLTVNGPATFTGASSFTGSGNTGTLGIGATALAANNAWTGNETHTGTETFTNSLTSGKLNGIFSPDGTQYTTLQAAISAIPTTGTIGGVVLLPPNTAKLQDNFGIIQDGATALTGLGIGAFVHIFDLSRYYKLDDNSGVNSGYTHAPRIWMFGSDTLGSGNSSEFELGAPNHVSLTLHSISGTVRLIDPTTGCVGNGTSTTCTIKVGEPNISWGTTTACLHGFTAGSALNNCFALTSSTTTTFTFNSSFNGTALGNSFTVANQGTSAASNRSGVVWRQDDVWTKWELGVGINGTSAAGTGAQSFSLQNYTDTQGGSTYWMVDPWTGTFGINTNSVDNTLALQIFPRVNVAPKLKLMGPASRIILNDTGNNGSIIEFDDANVADAFVLWSGTSGTPTSMVQILSNISGGAVQILTDTGIAAKSAATFDSTQKVLIPKALMACTSGLSNHQCDSGTAATLTGTGACATITTQTGGAWAGSAKCTGATAASTLTITPGSTATNGWICNVQDETTRANLFQQTSHTTTTCVLTVTSVTQNDVFVFSALAF